MPDKSELGRAADKFYALPAGKQAAWRRRAEEDAGRGNEGAKALLMEIEARGHRAGDPMEIEMSGGEKRQVRRPAPAPGGMSDADERRITLDDFRRNEREAGVFDGDALPGRAAIGGTQALWTLPGAGVAGVKAARGEDNFLDAYSDQIDNAGALFGAARYQPEMYESLENLRARLLESGAASDLEARVNKEIPRGGGDDPAKRDEVNRAREQLRAELRKNGVSEGTLEAKLGEIAPRAAFNRGAMERDAEGRLMMGNNPAEQATRMGFSMGMPFNPGPWRTMQGTGAQWVGRFIDSAGTGLARGLGHIAGHGVDSGVNLAALYLGASATDDAELGAALTPLGMGAARWAMWRGYDATKAGVKKFRDGKTMKKTIEGVYRRQSDFELLGGEEGIAARDALRRRRDAVRADLAAHNDDLGLSRKAAMEDADAVAREFPDLPLASGLGPEAARALVYEKTQKAPEAVAGLLGKLRAFRAMTFGRMRDANKEHMEWPPGASAIYGEKRKGLTSRIQQNAWGQFKKEQAAVNEKFMPKWSGSAEGVEFNIDRAVADLLAEDNSAFTSVQMGKLGKTHPQANKPGRKTKKDEVAEQNADKLAQAEMDKSLAWSEKAESFAEELETLRANPDAKESDVNALVALARQATDAAKNHKEAALLVRATSGGARSYKLEELQNLSQAASKRVYQLSKNPDRRADKMRVQAFRDQVDKVLGEADPEGFAKFQEYRRRYTAVMDRQDTDFLRWLRTSRRSTEYLRKTRDAMANPAKMEEWIEAGGGLDSAVMAAADGLTGDEMVDLSRKLFTATGDKQLYSEFGRGQLNQFRRRIGEMAIAEMSRPDRAGKRLSSFMSSPEGREALQRMYTHFKNNPEGRFLRAAAMDEMLFTPVARKGNPKQFHTAVHDFLDPKTGAPGLVNDREKRALELLADVSEVGDEVEKGANAALLESARKGGAVRLAGHMFRIFNKSFIAGMRYLTMSGFGAVAKDVHEAMKGDRFLWRLAMDLGEGDQEAVAALEQVAKYAKEGVEGPAPTLVGWLRKAGAKTAKASLALTKTAQKYGVPAARVNKDPDPAKFERDAGDLLDVMPAAAP